MEISPVSLSILVVFSSIHFLIAKQEEMDVSGPKKELKFDLGKGGVARDLWNGDDWSISYPRQSPIDIVTCQAVTMDLPELTLFSDSLSGVRTVMTNDGHSVTLELSEELTPYRRPHLQGGPLRNKYVLSNIHIHWGVSDRWGSEHFLNGRSFSAEVHVVFYNSKYRYFEVAKNYGDGLAVLAVMVQATSVDEPMVYDMVSKLPQITKYGSSTEMDNTRVFQWVFRALLTNHDYFSYPGSLTSEPYTENVSWIVLPRPLYMSYNQIEALRQIRDKDGGAPIVSNRREVQPVFYRRVLHAFRLSCDEWGGDYVEWYKEQPMWH